MSSKPFKPWQDKEILEDLYVTQQLTMRTIASLLGTSAPTIKYWIEKFDIEAREFNIGSLHKGQKLSEEHKAKISESVKQRFSNKENHPMHGKKHSPETRQKMSKARIKKMQQQAQEQETQCEDG